MKLKLTQVQMFDFEERLKDLDRSAIPYDYTFADMVIEALDEVLTRASYRGPQECPLCGHTPAAETRAAVATAAAPPSAGRAP